MEDVASGRVKLTNQEAVSLLTTLSNSDNTIQVPVEFRINNDVGECGIYRVSDGKQLWGGRVLYDGRSLTVTNALMDPDGNGLAYIDVVTPTDGESGVALAPALRLMAPDYTGAYEPDPENPSLNPDPVGSFPMISMYGYISPAWAGEEGYINECYSYIKGTGDFGISTGSALYLGGGNGVSIEGGFFISNGDLDAHGHEAIYLDFSLRPLRYGSTTSQYIGNSTYRWQTIYLRANPDVYSDERIKQDILRIDNASELLLKIPAYQFRMRDDPSKLHYGSTWQGVRDALLSCGILDAAILGEDAENDSEIHGLLYGEFSGLLLAGFQEHQKRFIDMENAMNDQRREIDDLKEMIRKLEK